MLAQYPSERTIRFLFCNEEHTPWTSVTAAQNAKARGDKIVAVFNLDGIGAKTAEDTAAGKKTNVTAYTEPAGERLAELMSAVNARFAIGLEQRSVKRSSPGDDDGSFVRAGFGAAVVNIGSWPYGDPNYHVEGDIPERVRRPQRRHDGASHPGGHPDAGSRSLAFAWERTVLAACLSGTQTGVFSRRSLRQWGTRQRLETRPRAASQPVFQKSVGEQELVLDNSPGTCENLGRWARRPLLSYLSHSPSSRALEA